MKPKKKRIKLIFWVILLLVAFLIVNLGNFARILYPAKHIDYIKKYSAEYEVNPYLIMSIIKAESNFNADAVSHKNATGLMQIIRPTANWLAQRMNLSGFTYDDITDPEVNIQMGCYYVSYLLDHYDGNTENALAAYNAGEGTVDRWLKDAECSDDGQNLCYIPYPETRRYIKKVTRNQEIYGALYEIPGAATPQ